MMERRWTPALGSRLPLMRKKKMVVRQTRLAINWGKYQINQNWPNPLLCFLELEPGVKGRRINWKNRARC